MQNAVDVVWAAILTEEIKTARLGVALRTVLNLQHYPLKRALRKRQQLVDRKGWIRVPRKTRKDKRDLQVAIDYWHNTATRFDSFSPRKKRKWIGLVLLSSLSCLMCV
jgi:hypothetical protein